MSVIGSVVRAFPIRADAPGLNDERMWKQSSGPMTAAGIRVNADTAMKLSVVWRCVQLISDSVASLPLSVYARRSDGGRDEARGHPLFDLLHGPPGPNPRQTAYEFRELQQQHLLLRGNAYAQILPGPRGAVDTLWPLHPDSVTPREQPDRSIKYEVRTPNNPPQTLFDDEVLHLRGLGNDSIMGLAVLDYARESMGLGLAQEQYASRFFSQSEVPPIVLKAAGALNDQARQRNKEAWTEATASWNNRFRAALLEGGIDVQTLNVGLTAEQAQLVESRETTGEDLARWFGVANHMVGLQSKSSSWGTGIEQMSIGFVVYTLVASWLVRLEQRYDKDLILNNRTFFTKHNVLSLLRGDAKSQAEALQIERQNGVINGNDWRGLRDLNPVKGGEDYWRPANMAVVGAPDPKPIDDHAPAQQSEHSARNNAGPTDTEIHAWLAAYRERVAGEGS